MSVYIGHASISENGTINGSKGDSTGKEVCVREWYSISADFMAIHPEAAVREKHAQAVEAACKNDNIGYGQGDRNTLNTLAKVVNYDLSNVGKCNCDCSSLQNVAAVASGAAGVTYGSNGWTTSTMKAALQAAGYKIITNKAYLESADYCVRGAIYVKASSHTVCGLTNGSKAAQMLEKAGISDTSLSSGISAAGATLAVGSIVNFIGKLHYTSANSTSGKSCKPGKAKITQIYSGKHPYHLEAVSGGGSTVHGWVDTADIQEGSKVGAPVSSTELEVAQKKPAAGSSGSTMHIVKRGDTLYSLAKRYKTTVDKIVADNKGRYPKITARYIVAGWELTII